MRKQDRIRKLKRERKQSGKYSPNKSLNYRLEQHHNRSSHTPSDNKGRKKAAEQLVQFKEKYPDLFK